MSYEALSSVILCADENCDCAYIWEPEEGTLPNFHNDILPCGHKLGMIYFGFSDIKKNEEAARMLDYLKENHMIKYAAFDKIRELGGKLESSGNCRVPDRDLNEDELEDMDWE